MDNVAHNDYRLYIFSLPYIYITRSIYGSMDQITKDDHGIEWTNFFLFFHWFLEWQRLAMIFKKEKMSLCYENVSLNVFILATIQIFLLLMSFLPLNIISSYNLEFYFDYIDGIHHQTVSTEFFSIDLVYGCIKQKIDRFYNKYKKAHQTPNTHRH